MSRPYIHEAHGADSQSLAKALSHWRPQCCTSATTIISSTASSRAIPFQDLEMVVYTTLLKGLVILQARLCSEK
jgi:hypothetical protein